jgi:hypothetical protein
MAIRPSAATSRPLPSPPYATSSPLTLAVTGAVTLLIVWALSTGHIALGIGVLVAVMVLPEFVLIPPQRAGGQFPVHLEQNGRPNRERSERLDHHHRPTVLDLGPTPDAEPGTD